MKKIITILLVSLTFGSMAQTEKGLFFDASMGARFGGATSNQVTMGPGFHAAGGIGYMFSNIIGIKGHLGFNTFNAVSVMDEGINDQSVMFNTSLQAEFVLSQLIGFGTEKFDLNLHAGFGFTTFSNRGFKESYKQNNEFQDRFFEGNDEAVNINFGLSPRFHINEKISLNVDASYFVIFGQNHSIDREIGNTFIEGTTGITTASIGMTYRL